MQSEKNAVRTICKIVFAIPYIALNLYTILFCSYHSMRPVYVFFNTDFFRYGAGRTFSNMIGVNDGSAFLYLLIFLIGIISLIVLSILNRHEKKIFTALILSVIPLTVTCITWYTVPEYTLGDIKCLYWLFIVWCVATLVFPISEAVRKQRRKQKQPKEANE